MYVNERQTGVAVKMQGAEVVEAGNFKYLNPSNVHRRGEEESAYLNWICLLILFSIIIVLCLILTSVFACFIFYFYKLYIILYVSYYVCSCVCVCVCLSG